MEDEAKISRAHAVAPLRPTAVNRVSVGLVVQNYSIEVTNNGSILHPAAAPESPKVGTGGQLPADARYLDMGRWAWGQMVYSRYMASFLAVYAQGSFLLKECKSTDGSRHRRKIKGKRIRQGLGGPSGSGASCNFVQRTSHPCLAPLLHNIFAWHRTTRKEASWPSGADSEWGRRYQG